MQSFKSFELQTFFFFSNPSISFSKLELLLIHGQYPKKVNDLWRNLLLFYIERDNFQSQLLWFLKIKRIRSQKLCARLKVINWFLKAFIPCSELQFFDWPSIVAHLRAGLMYVAYGLVILVHRNIQVTTITIGYIPLRQGFWVLACGRRADLSA